MSFVRYNTEDSVISAETVVKGLWSGDNNTLSTFFTASGYTEYYLDVYQTGSTALGSSIQFDIQYGNLFGSGSTLINASVPGKSPSRVVYGQYRNLVYGTENTNFSFNGGNTISNEIFIINISRARYKESLLPGSFNLKLTSGSSTFYLTDDSGTTNLTRFIGENRYYNIISGSNGSGSMSDTMYYGLFFPDLDIIILNPSSSISSSIPPATGNNNHLRLFTSISSGSYGVNSGSFQLKSQETVSSRYFFTRIKNSDFNYTTNPSIIDDNGNLLYTTLINNPQTYITTVGMYNDNNELLAVAKLSKPLVKDFTKEALVRVKLDY
jgi:hypothetical protein